ncbi:glycoside hydrolase superfamily [Dendryphion nanum]|uniref:Beta-mannosidase A n=1 Tax=Dendryphion nanum TaxID=256645 RepID=A0A9P9IPU7_9PLEO|nr:glycoside hydrolase superfamily [Dendryphion nanum]
MILAASIISTGFAQQILDLGTVEWTLTSPEHSNISISAKFPSQAHLDLYAAGVIDHPLHGLNDFNLRWVAESNWTYTSAPITALDRGAESIWLVFNGLDTFSSITLCEQHVAATNNQFRQYYFDVTGVISSCTDTTLSLNFGSAPRIADDIAAIPGQEKWPPGVQGLFEYPNRHFIRKEQNDFGWDWGPAFAPAGPWQPAYLVQLGPGDIYVRNTLVDIFREEQLNLIPPDQTKNWVVVVSIDYLGTGSGLPPDTSLNFKLTDSKGAIVLEGPFFDTKLDAISINASTIIPKEAVELWWPVGFGLQTLYNLEIDVVDNKSAVLTSVTKRVGFRTIVQNASPITNEQRAKGIGNGNNWHFEVNGQVFYAKGSNFIPPDPFWANVTETRIRQLFQSVVDGNQNMLRVWSSGAYSPDFMYDLADEMGLLLWSEFQFGDALYPVDKEFLDNVREEVRYQVRRVNHHPSLAFWAGGNELENLELKYVKYTPDYDRYVAEYETLFLDTIVPVLFGNSRSISYSPSSTSNGWLELNFSRPQPITQRYDNISQGHYYGNTEDHYHYDSSAAFDYSTYPTGRFANEFGYHSMPSLQTWLQAVDPAELNLESEVVALRNHHYPVGGLAQDPTKGRKGINEMVTAVNNWYPAPAHSGPLTNFSSWCHTTQIFQADYYKSQIEYYRRGSALPERNLGSLYWQLEDQWQAPTWAGIEYDGRWKVLHYAAKDIYQPVIVAPFFKNKTGVLEVWVISDLWSPIYTSVNLTWVDWTGQQLDISPSISQGAEVGAINGTKVMSYNTTELFAGQDKTNILLRMDVLARGNLPNSLKAQIFRHTNWFHASQLSTAKLVDPGLEFHYDEATEKFIVKATTGVAAWVWLDYPAGVVLNFDANGFWLLPGQEKQIGYTVKSDSTNGKWVYGVLLRSLWDNKVTTW